MALAFGTGGLRGLLGDGEDFLNEQTITRATRGVAAYLLAKDAAAAKHSGVAIAYDTRHYSLDFAQTTAAVFEACGIPAYLFESPTPTPTLSFAVRHLGCVGGIVVTASHNPKEYNGYKVYNGDGCQLVPDEAEQVITCINAVNDPTVPLPGASRPVPADVDSDYLKAVLSRSLMPEEAPKKAISIVYTALHGTGARFVPDILAQDGFTNIQSVGQQATADGDFPTVKSPNPEDRNALTMAIEQAQQVQADLVIGTDPDCDRVGAAVLHNHEYHLITGNQMGALLMDYILARTVPLPQNGAVVKTIVTNDLGAVLAKEAGLTVFETLTGFKFIGEKIGQFERSGNHAYVFGYEESYGYLSGTYVRDKDAVVSSMLIAELTAMHKQAGRTLIDALEGLYKRHGVYLDALDTIEVHSIAETDAVMAKMRNAGGSAFTPPADMFDYKPGLDGLPPSDVLKYRWPVGSWMAVRPSGTEPKLKIYYSATGKTHEAAEEALAHMRAEASAIIKGE